MQTTVHERYLELPRIDEADAILRSCVHCGFCNATCPTYLEIGDERDGPRGRIYLIKQLLEGGDVSVQTHVHLDRCLTCRSCETTCPSGVEYGRLVDIGRGIIERQIKRSWSQRVARWLVKQLVPHRRRFGLLLRIGQLFRRIAPTKLRAAIPPKQHCSAWPRNKHPRKVLALEGCAQAAATPNTNAAAARVLDKLGIELISVPTAGCCGALSYHLADHEDGLSFARRNIDAWWQEIEQGAEAIAISASGCATMIKDYGLLLNDDPAYADKARTVSALAKDIAEILGNENLTALQLDGRSTKVAFHCPCTLQHGQRLPGIVEKILIQSGFELAETKDNHLCCGSAGTYSILQPKLSRKLRSNKLSALTLDEPKLIATANVGCQLHLAGAASVPVNHWIELIDEASTSPVGAASTEINQTVSPGRAFC